MSEQTINGKRVVFRDKIPAVFGWKLLSPMGRLTRALTKRREEIRAKAPETIPEELLAIPGDEAVEIMAETLSWPDVVALVRAAVESWEFDGDLAEKTCCDDLDAIDELLPIALAARRIYFASDLQGEADGGPTNT